VLRSFTELFPLSPSESRYLILARQILRGSYDLATDSETSCFPIPGISIYPFLNILTRYPIFLATIPSWGFIRLTYVIANKDYDQPLHFFLPFFYETCFLGILALSGQVEVYQFAHVSCLFSSSESSEFLEQLRTPGIQSEVTDSALAPRLSTLAGVLFIVNLSSIQNHLFDRFLPLTCSAASNRSNTQTISIHYFEEELFQIGKRRKI